MSGHNRWTPWLMWGLLLPTYGIAFFHRTALSPIADDLAVTFDLTGSVGTRLGSLAGVYFLVYMLLQIPSGIVADTIGARVVVCIGGIIMGLGTLGFAAAQSIETALVMRFLIGFGAAFNFIALLRQQVNWFDRQAFPALTAAVVVVGNLGALSGIGPFALISRTIGWRTGMTIVGVLTLCCAGGVGVWVRNRPQRPAPAASPPFIDGLLSVVTNKTNYLTFVVFGITSGIQLTFGGFWGTVFLEQVHHLDRLVASGCTTMMMLGVAIGCMVTPLFVRMIGSPRRTGIIMLGITGGFWAWTFFGPLPTRFPWALYLFFTALGFFLSAFILPYTTVRSVNREAAMGTALAFTNTGGFLAIALFQVLVGIILDRFAGPQTSAGGGMPLYPVAAWHRALGLLLALHAGAVCTYGLIREPRSTVSLPGCAHPQSS